MSIFGFGAWALVGLAGAGLVLWISVRRSLELRRRRRAAALAAGPETPEAGDADATVAARVAARVVAPATPAALAGGSPAGGTPGHAPGQTPGHAPGGARGWFGTGRHADAPPPRLEAILAVQADLAARVEALAAGQSAPEERLQAMATQLLGLVRDKNATLETALAGLDQLRERMRAIEQMGEPAEARALLGRLEARLDEIRSAQAAAAAALEARIAGLEAPSETRAEHRAENPVAEIADRLTRLHAQKDAVAENVLARIAAVEASLAARDAGPAVDRLAARLDDTRGALEARLAGLEAANPLAELSEQFARLHAGKDAAVETVFSRLAPLETRLADLAVRVEGRDPAPGLARLESRIEDQVAALKAAGAAAEAALAARLAALETPDENPFAEISEQLTRLYAQKDAAVETVFARLAPLEERLGALDRRLAGQDPASALDRFAERLEAVRTGLEGRLALLETPDENPFGEISEQLTRLYAQKDAAVETVFARLAPLEERLGALEVGVATLRPLAEADPRAEIDGLAARIEALHWAQGEVAAGLAALKAAADAEAAVEAAGLSPVAGVADQLTRLYAQKDAGLAAVLERLAPLETRLAGLEGRPWDPPRDMEAEAAREEARAQAQAIAAQMIAARTAADQVAAQTGLFADRLALLEASLPRLSAAQATLVQALEARTLALAAPASAAAIAPSPMPAAAAAPTETAAAPQATPGAAPGEAPEQAPGAEMAPASAPAPVAPPAADDIWDLPRLISLHHR